MRSDKTNTIQQKFNPPFDLKEANARVEEFLKKYPQLAEKVDELRNRLKKNSPQNIPT